MACAGSIVPPLDKSLVMPVARKVWQQVEERRPAARARRLVNWFQKNKHFRALARSDAKETMNDISDRAWRSSRRRSSQNAS
jgi:hypothetical protein